jgi:tetratricopeptide (TPR) repeat protein
MTTDRPSRPILPLDSLEGPALPLAAAAVERMAGEIAARAASAQNTAGSGSRRQPLPLGMRWRIGIGAVVATGSAAAVFWVNDHGARTVDEAALAMSLDAGTRQTVTRMRTVAEPISSAEHGSAGPSGSAAGARSLAAARSSTASQWLEQANKLRRAQQWSHATSIYELIVREYPSSAEAYSARVASASLRLEKLGDPVGARQLYAQALRSPGSGALREEILWGLARATRSCGDYQAERATLERLLAEHPQTLHAARARTRLGQLETESK